MLDILSDRTYRHLFLAQVVALLGTGLATVALGLLAFDLSGDGAALVLGTVFTIKMVAYVGIVPIAGAFADRVPRRALLVTLDLVRAGVALAPFSGVLRRAMLKPACASCKWKPGWIPAPFACGGPCRLNTPTPPPPCTTNWPSWAVICW